MIGLYLFDTTTHLVKMHLNYARRRSPKALPPVQLVHVFVRPTSIGGGIVCIRIPRRDELSMQPHGLDLDRAVRDVTGLCAFT